MSEVGSENSPFHRKIGKKGLLSKDSTPDQNALENKENEYFPEDQQYDVDDFQSQIDSLFEESEDESSTENTKNRCENDSFLHKATTFENDPMQSTESLLNHMLSQSEVHTLPVEQESKCFDDYQNQKISNNETSVESPTERSVLEDLDFDSLFGENQDLVGSLLSRNESSESSNDSFENSPQNSENSTDQYSTLLSSIALPSQIPLTKRKRNDESQNRSKFSSLDKTRIDQPKYLHTPSPFVMSSSLNQNYHGRTYVNQVLENKRARLGENFPNNACSNYNNFPKSNFQFPPNNFGSKNIGNQNKTSVNKPNTPYDSFNISQFTNSPPPEKESLSDTCKMVSTSPLLPQKDQLPDLLLPSDIKQVPDINLDSPCESASLSPSSPSGQSLASFSCSSSDTKNDMSNYSSAYTYSTVNNSTIAKIKAQMVSAHNLISTYTALKRTTQCISDCLVSTKNQNASLRKENEKLAKQNIIFNKEKLLLKQALNKLHRDTNGMGKNEVLLKEISKLNLEIVRLRKKCKEI